MVMEERRVVRCEITLTRQNILDETERVKLFTSSQQQQQRLWHTENKDATYSTEQLIEEICDFFKEDGRYLSNISVHLKIYTIPYKFTRLEEDLVDREFKSVYFHFKDGTVVEEPTWKLMSEAKNLIGTDFPPPLVVPGLRYIIANSGRRADKLKNILPFEKLISIPLEPWRVD